MSAVEFLGLVAIIWFGGWMFDVVVRWLDSFPTRPRSLNKCHHGVDWRGIYPCLKCEEERKRRNE